MLHYVLSRPRLAPAQRGLSYSQAIAPIVLLPRSGLVQYLFRDTEYPLSPQDVKPSLLGRECQLLSPKASLLEAPQTALAQV
jgi:hypothetical protein